MDWEFMKVVIMVITAFVMFFGWAYLQHKDMTGDRELVSIEEIKTGKYKGYYEIHSRVKYINDEQRKSLHYTNIGKDGVWYCKEAGWLVTTGIVNWNDEQLRLCEFKKLKPLDKQS